MDASDAGIGAVWLQERKDDIDLTNCYFSKTLYKDIKKLSTFKKKRLALLLSLKPFDVHFIQSWCLLITIPSHLINANKKSQINDYCYKNTI